MTVGTKAFSPAERLLMVGRNDQSELKVLEPLMSSGRSPATMPPCSECLKPWPEKHLIVACLFYS